MGAHRAAVPSLYAEATAFLRPRYRRSFTPSGQSVIVRCSWCSASITTDRQSVAEEFTSTHECPEVAA